MKQPCILSQVCTGLLSATLTRAKLLPPINGSWCINAVCILSTGLMCCKVFRTTASVFYKTLLLKEQRTLYSCTVVRTEGVGTKGSSTLNGARDWGGRGWSGVGKWAKWGTEGWELGCTFWVELGTEGRKKTKWRVGLRGMVLRACELSGGGDLEGRGHWETEWVRELMEQGVGIDWDVRKNTVNLVKIQKSNFHKLSAVCLKML